MTGTHLDHLAEALQHSVQSASPQVRTAMLAVSLESHELCLAAQARDAAYFRRLVHELVRIRGSQLAEVRIGCLFDAARFFYLACDSDATVAAAKHALDLARQERLRDLQWRAHELLGVAFRDIMNLSTSMREFASAIAIVDDLRDDEACARLAIEVAVLLNLAGQAEQARGALLFSLRFGEAASPSPPWLPRALTAYAETCLALDDPQQALPAIERAVQAAKEPENASDVMAALSRESVYIRVLHALSHFAAARARTVEAARPLAQRSPGRRAAVRFALLEAACDVREKNFDLGITRLTRLLEESRALGTEESIQREILVEIHQSHRLAGDVRKELQSLRELGEITRRTWQDTMLAQHHSHMQRVGVRSSPATSPPGRGVRELFLEGKVRELDLFQANIEMLERFAVDAELGEDPSGDHIYRVGRLAALIAEEHGIAGPEECGMIELAARLHDIGKSPIPAQLLLQPGPLTEAQRAFMQEHTTKGVELLEKAHVPQMRMALDIARYHHERWDGSGYPHSLSGSAIPYPARVVAIADVFDALTHPRRWRKAWTAREAIDYIRERAGTQFDPALAPVAVRLLERLVKKECDIDDFLVGEVLDRTFAESRKALRGALEPASRPGAGGAS